MIIPRPRAPEADPSIKFLTSIQLPENVWIDPVRRTIEYRMNQSRLQVFMDCQRRFGWKFDQNLEPDRPQIKLELGSGVHEGLAVLAAGGDMATAVAHSVARFRKYLPTRLLPGDTEEIEKAEDTIRALLPAYADHWTQQNFTPLGLEIGGKVEVGRFTIDGQEWVSRLVFRLDKLVTFNNQLWIVDHKTAAKLDLRDIAKYAIDVQMTAYTYAATRMLQEQAKELGLSQEPRVQGVIIDVLVKTKVPQFHRDSFYRTDGDLIEFQYDWTIWSEQMVRAKLRADQFEASGLPRMLAYPKNTRSCYHYGTCPFLNLCIKDTPTNRAEFIKRPVDYVEDETKLQKERLKDA
jgi:hypothetical protein